MSKLLLWLTMWFIPFSLFAEDDSCYCESPAKVYSRRIKITQKDYNYETRFDIDSEYGSLGSVVQSHISFRKNYTYYDIKGIAQSVAYSRLGSFGPASTTLDIYDKQGHQIAMIDGTLLFTLAPAQFYFYDAENKVIGIAELDKSKTNFTIYDPENSYHIIASFNRVLKKNEIDHWEVEFIDSDAMDIRVLLTFGAFVVDTQEKFLEDN